MIEYVEEMICPNCGKKVEPEIKGSWMVYKYECVYCGTRCETKRSIKDTGVSPDLIF